MFEKNKYDVMESETTKTSMSLLLLVGKIVKDFKSYEREQVRTKEFDIKFANTVDKGLPGVKSLAHIGYENSLDIANMDQDKLLKYMSEKGIKKEDFISNYYYKVNTYAKVILGFAIVDIEKVDIHKVITPESMLSLIKGDLSGIRNAIVESGIKLSTGSKKLLDKLARNGFDIKELNSKEKELLNKVHSNYMDKNILPKVNDKSLSQQQVLKYARSIGKKKSLVDI